MKRKGCGRCGRLGITWGVGFRASTAESFVEGAPMLLCTWSIVVEEATPVDLERCADDAALG